MPELAVPVATYFGWNYRDPSTGAPEHLAGEIASYIGFPRTSTERFKTADSRVSIEERYPSKQAYLDRVRAAASELVAGRYLLEWDVPQVVRHASWIWVWANYSVRPIYLGLAAAGLALALLAGIAYLFWRVKRR